MISLGIGELVASSSLILRSFFGGEAGITTNRTALPHMFGWSFGPQIQVYYLIAFWMMISAIAMYALTRTPLGRMCNAVRDNPERVEFIGYDPHVVRYLAFCFAGFFAGIAGGLAAINFEIANSAYLGATQSGLVLFAAYHRRRRLFLRPDPRRDPRHLSAARADRPHHGLAALFRPDLHRHRDVRAGRHRRPVDDASPADPRRHACHGDPVLSRRVAADAGAGRSASSSPSRRSRATPQARAKATSSISFGIPFDATAPTTWLVAAVLVVGGFLVARLTWRRVAEAWDRAATVARDRGYLA